jgi:hypothetical protein
VRLQSRRANPRVQKVLCRRQPASVRRQRRLPRAGAGLACGAVHAAVLGGPGARRAPHTGKSGSPAWRQRGTAHEACSDARPAERLAVRSSAPGKACCCVRCCTRNPGWPCCSWHTAGTLLSTPVLVQGGGVFCNPVSPSAGPKLRCLYETFPLAFIVEAAGGASHDGRGSGAAVLGGGT